MMLILMINNKYDKKELNIKYYNYIIIKYLLFL